jgi:hypothetical protein
MYLLKKNNQNILLTGKNVENTFDIVASVIRSVTMGNYQTVILADKENPYAKLLESEMDTLDPQGKIAVFENADDIDEFIAAMQKSCGDEEKDLKIFMIWLGAQNFVTNMGELWNAGKNGILHMLVTENAETFAKIPDVDLTQFDHKLSTEISKEELVALGYPYAALQNVELDSVKAIYSNGSKIFAFKPYRFLK